MSIQADSHLWSLVRTQEGWFASRWNTMRTRAYGIFNDETLVLRARSGDFAAFDALVARYADRLYAMAFSSLGNTAEATAAVSEAVCSAFRDIDSEGPHCSPAVWLHVHCFRAVFQRLNVPPGRYVVTREEPPTRSESRRRSHYAGANLSLDVVHSRRLAEVLDPLRSQCGTGIAAIQDSGLEPESCNSRVGGLR